MKGSASGDRLQAIEGALFEGLLTALEEEVGRTASERVVLGDQFRDGYTPPRQMT